MIKLLLHIVLAALIPAVFIFYYIDAGKAEGWGGWAYGVALGSILILSISIGLVLAIICFLRWWKLKPDWHIWAMDTLIVISPLLFVIFNAQPVSQAEIKTDWFLCKTNSECKSTWLSCQSWTAVNTQHEDNYLNWYYQENNEFLSMAECDGPTAVSPAALCRNVKCVLVDN